LAFIAAGSSDNFTIGVKTYYKPAPVFGEYPVCGRYPGQVPAGATVSLRCDRTRWGYHVIAQFPTTGLMNFREIDVCGYGESITIH